MIENKTKKEKNQAKTRKLSIKEGAGAVVQSSVGEAYLIPYAIELKATNLQIGILSSLAQLLGPIAQLLGSRLIEKYHRRNLVVFSVILQATSWLPIIALGLIFSIFGPAFYLVPLLIVAYVVYASTGALGGPAWFSLIGDAVPEKIRGRWFAKRNKILGIFSVISTLIASVLLFYLEKQIVIGFIILFLIASIARYISAYYLNQHYVEPLKLEKGYYFSFGRFIKKIFHYNFNTFALYVALISLGANIAGPFFAVYMWKVLGFNPLWFTAVIVSGSLFILMFYPWWGRFADKYGNRELLKIGSIIIIVPPFLWLGSTNPIYLMLVPQFIAGIGWSAFMLASSNFIYDSIKPQRRALCVAYYNMLNGIGIFTGALLGGLLAQYIHLSFINVFFLLFIVSSLFRMVVVALLLPRIKEVRLEHHPVKKNPLNYLKEVKPIYGGFISTMYPMNIYRFIAIRTKKLLRK